jgi:hypothetical protein
MSWMRTAGVESEPHCSAPSRRLRGRAAEQDDTLVAKPHRGHGLGILVKLANLRRLQKEYPEVERVMTFNAEENEHMLSINVQLGFKPAGYDGEWQKRIK